jgi:hypothetical protein
MRLAASEAAPSVLPASVRGLPWSRRWREAGSGLDVLDLLTMVIEVPAKELQTLLCVERTADDVRVIADARSSGIASPSTVRRTSAASGRIAGRSSGSMHDSRSS